MITRELIESYEGLKFVESDLMGDHYRNESNKMWLIYKESQDQIEFGWDDNVMADLVNVETEEEFKVIMKCADFKQFNEKEYIEYLQLNNIRCKELDEKFDKLDEELDKKLDKEEIQKAQEEYKKIMEYRRTEPQSEEEKLWLNADMSLENSKLDKDTHTFDLDKEEQEISDSIANKEWVTVENVEEEKERYSKIAQNQIN